MKRAIQCPELLAFLQRIIPVGASVLDIGCGNKWYWPHINASFIGIDAWNKFEPDFCINLEKSDLPFIRTDVALMLDVIEHLNGLRGAVILEQAKRAADTVILLTPKTWETNEQAMHDEEGDYYNNPFVVHKSLWHPGYFQGFEEQTILPLTRETYLGIWRKK